MFIKPFLKSLFLRVFVLLPICLPPLVGDKSWYFDEEKGGGVLGRCAPPRHQVAAGGAAAALGRSSSVPGATSAWQQLGKLHLSSSKTSVPNRNIVWMDSNNSLLIRNTKRTTFQGLILHLLITCWQKTRNSKCWLSSLHYTESSPPASSVCCCRGDETGLQLNPAAVRWPYTVKLL